VHENPLAPIFGRTNRNQLVLAHAPHLADPQFAVLREHQHAVHSRLARHLPLALDANVSGKIRGRKEAFGEHTVGGRGHEARVRGASELGRRQVRMKKCGHP